jgi:hypothetical protein
MHGHVKENLNNCIPIQPMVYFLLYILYQGEFLNRIITF